MAKQKGQKVPVSMRALLARINRKLRPDQEAIRKNRGAWSTDIGEYYVLNWNHNRIENSHADPVAIGRELGCLQKWEEVVE